MREGRDLVLAFVLSVIALGAMANYHPSSDPGFADGQAIIPPSKNSFYATKMFTEPVLEGIVGQSRGRLVASSDSSPVYLNFALVSFNGGEICEISQPQQSIPCGEYVLMSITNDEDIEELQIIGQKTPTITAISGNQAEILFPRENKYSFDLQIIIVDSAVNILPSSGKLNVALI